VCEREREREKPFSVSEWRVSTASTKIKQWETEACNLSTFLVHCKAGRNVVCSALHFNDPRNGVVSKLFLDVSRRFRITPSPIYLDGLV
jgi:hypothetical protein